LHTPFKLLYSHNIQSGLTSNYQKKKTEIKTTKKKSIEIKKNRILER